MHPPAGPWNPLPPTIVQIAHTHGNGANLVFPALTTIGNLIVVLQARRDGDPPVPSGEVWTDLVGHTVQFKRDGGANEQTCRGRGATVTVARTTYTGFSGTATIQCAWEVAHSALPGITEIDISDQSSTTNADIGSLGALGLDRLALMMIGTGADFSLVRVAPFGPWVVDFMGGRDLESTTDVLSSPAAYPEEWFGHAVGDGSTVEAKINLDAAHNYGGIAVLLA